jgi:polyisoprenoid-binding protein YceI
MKRFRLDLEQSEISWTGVQPVKDISGKVFFKGGMICMDQDKVIEGEVIIDMNSIVATDEKLDADSKKQLASDLKSANFFNADIYPTASLKTKEIKYLEQEDLKNDTSFRIPNATHDVSAFLTIKEVTHEINFGAKITFSPNHLKIEALLKVDRTQWGINFMTEESYGDKKIHNDLHINVKITAEGIDEL